MLWKEEFWQQTLLYRGSGWNSAFLSSVGCSFAGLMIDWNTDNTKIHASMKAMWKAAWGPAAHILNVQGGTSGSLCQSWRPCPRDIDATQGEEFASGGGAKHPILLVPWLCLDHCRVLGMLVIATLYLRGCSQSQIVVTSCFLQGPHWMEVHRLFQQIGSRKVLWVLQEIHWVEERGTKGFKAGWPARRDERHCHVIKWHLAALFLMKIS